MTMSYEEYVQTQPKRGGFVYILSNPMFPGLLKIGMTTNAPSVRANELSSTASPEPFEVLFYIECEDPLRAEREAHQRLSGKRHAKNREFFKADLEEAIDVLLSIPHLAYSGPLAVEDIYHEIEILQDKNNADQIQYAEREKYHKKIHIAMAVVIAVLLVYLYVSSH